MAFQLPTFNLLCNLWTSAGPSWPVFAKPTGSPRIANQPCGLAHGRLSSKVWNIGNSFLTAPYGVMQLLLPKLTDVRGLEVGVGGCDWCECPSGSGRYYAVASVDDVGKGYANEYRLAYLSAILETWVPPYP